MQEVPRGERPEGTSLMESKKRVVVVVDDISRLRELGEVVIAARPPVPKIDLPNRAARRGNRAKGKRWKQKS